MRQEGGDRRKKRREREETSKGATETGTWRDTDPSTYALVRTTVRVTSPSVAGGHFQACTFKALAGSTHHNRTTVGLVGPRSKMGWTRPQQTRARELARRSNWPPLART